MFNRLTGSALQNRPTSGAVDYDSVVSECFRTCMGMGDELSRVAAFLAGLNAAGWTADDIRVIESRIRNVLDGVIVYSAWAADNLVAAS